MNGGYDKCNINLIKITTDVSEYNKMLKEGDYLPDYLSKEEYQILIGT